MAPSIKRTIELSPEEARFVDERVARGDFPSAEDVVAAGLGALRAAERGEKAALDAWLREEVVPVYDAVRSGAEKTYDLDEVFDALERDLDRRTQ